MADWTEGFPALISPHSLDAFWAEHWERGPLHLRHGAGFVDGLFDLDDADELLTGMGLRHPTFRVLMEGREVPAAAYTHGSLPWGQGQVSHYIDYMQVLGMVRRGGVVVFDHVHRIWPALAELHRAVELAVGGRTRTTATLAPADQGSGPARYELHDLYVLQTVGQTRWQLSAPHLRLPVAGQECPADGVEPGDPVLDVVLEAGDLLYVPRGTVFETTSGRGFAVDVRVGVTPVTTLDVLRELVVAASEDARMRRGHRLDLHGPHDGGDAAQAELQATLTDLAGVADFDGLLDRIARGVARTRMPLLSGVLADLEQVEDVGLDSTVMRRDGIVWRAESAGDRVTLAFHERQLELPWHAIRTARFLGEAGPFLVRELPGELTDAQRLGIVRSLIGEGFLTVVDIG